MPFVILLNVQSNFQKKIFNGYRKIKKILLKYAKNNISHINTCTFNFPIGEFHSYKPKFTFKIIYSFIFESGLIRLLVLIDWFFFAQYN